jgi:hypothetical protein
VTPSTPWPAPSARRPAGAPSSSTPSSRPSTWSSRPTGAGGVTLVVAYRRWGGHQYIQAKHVTRALEAIYRHPGVPQTLTYTHYAPHLRAPIRRECGDGVL